MSNITVSRKRLAKIVKEEVKKHLLEEAEQQDAVRQMYDRAISQMEEHAELVRDTVLVTTGDDINPQQLQAVMKLQRQYIEELKKIKDGLR